jgi:tripartite-type tricarboxylate transporter receptor subunit TctC
MASKLVQNGMRAALTIGMSICVFGGNAAAQSSQAYPARPISVIVPVAAGGGADFLMRLLAGPLGERLGQNVLVENRPSADAGIGLAAGARAAPDGYTLVFMFPSMPFNVALREQPYKIEDFASISRMVDYYFAFVASPAFQGNNLSDLIRIAKANPGSVKYGSPGTSLLLLYLQFANRTGITTLNVPYKGAGASRPAAMSGEVDFTMDTPAGPAPLVASGKLKVLGVSGPKRMAIFPTAQAMEEVVPGFEIKAWLGLSGPAGMPRDRINRISREIADILKRPDIQKRMEAVYYEPVGSTPEELSASINADFEMYRKLMRDPNLKLE